MDLSGLSMETIPAFSPKNLPVFSLLIFTQTNRSENGELFKFLAARVIVAHLLKGKVYGGGRRLSLLNLLAAGLSGANTSINVPRSCGG